MNKKGIETHEKSECSLVGTYDDFQEIVRLPRGPVFPGHLCSASKDSLKSCFKDKVVPAAEEVLF